MNAQPLNSFRGHKKLSLPFHLAALSLGASLPLLAHNPKLGYVSPVALQSGTKATLHFHGERLSKAKEILFYHPGITIEGEPLVHSPKHVSFQVNIAADAPPGMHPVRLRCDDGITYQKTFSLTQYPIIQETDQENGTPEQAQIAESNKTIHGITKSEDVDYYAIELKKGQALSAEITGMRLGRTFFDPHLTLLDPDGKEIATSDDSPLTKQDPFITYTAEKDGKHFLAVRESSYEGSDSSHYLLHLGHFPRPAAIYPPGAKPGQAADFRFINRDGSHFETRLTPTPTQFTFAEKDGLRSPSPVPLRVNALDFTNEEEPNNGSKETLAPMKAPCAFHGIISKPGDVDWFKFQADKGQDITIQVLARELGSPLDARIILRDAKGKQIQSNDDANNRPDSKIDFKAPETGEYFVNIRDHLGNAGPQFTYRIELTPRTPSLSASVNRSDRRDSQKRKVINIPRGSRLAYQLNISRDRLSSAVKTSVSTLPQGVRLVSLTAEQGVNNIPLYFEAAPDAPLAGGLYPVHAESNKPAIKSAISETIEHIGINNEGIYSAFTSDKLAVAVIEESPFDISLSSPAVPAVRNGTINLEIQVNRKQGYDKEITLFFPWLPPGITAPGNVKIPKDKDKATYRLSIKGDAPVKTWQLCVSAESSTKEGTVLLSSNLVSLEIQEPYLTAKLDIAATTQGNPVSIPCKLEQLTSFEGNATLTLHGLPDGFTAKPVTINSSTTETLIPVELAKDARTGNHSNLFCHIEIPKNGHTVPHNTGHGGSLRVNKPPKDKSSAKKDSSQPKPSSKPLSRLEQLRQQAK